jgi:putative SOS response-associated peptidase YedK
MPVILAPDYDLWLDPPVQTHSVVLRLLTPFDAGSMRSYPVSTRVNTVANDDPECSAPVQLVAETANLFD